MSFEWDIVDIGDVCAVGDGAHSKVTRQTSGIPYLTSKNIGQGNLKLETTDFICNEDFERLFPLESKATRRPKAGDVLIGIIGTFGNAYLYKETDHFGFSSSIGILRPDQKRLVPEYLYYVITSRKFQEVHKNYNGGSVQGYTNIPTIKKLKLPLPPVSVQKQIAEILALLDSRITLLHETNATLEAIAQALFKSWFVNFDPVHAKQQGRMPEGMDEATAVLFPDSFEETEFGLMPKGWIAGTFGSFLKESNQRVGKNDAIVLSAIQTGELVKSEDHFNKRVHSKDISKYKLVEPYSFAYNPSRINIGSIGLNEFEYFGAVSPVYVVVTPESVSSSYFIWHHLRTEKVRDWINTLASGTVRQNLSFTDFSSIPLIVPDQKVLEAFYDLRRSIYQKYLANQEQAQTLATLRDTLLPRLTSGQLRLPEAELELEMEEALAYAC